MARYKQRLKWRKTGLGFFHVLDGNRRSAAEVHKREFGRGWIVFPITQALKAKLDMATPLSKLEELRAECERNGRLFDTKSDVESFIIEGYAAEKIEVWRRVMKVLDPEGDE